MARLEYEIIGDSTKLTAAIKQSVSGFTTLQSQADKTTAAINNEITSLGQLQKTLLQLNKDKLNIVDETRLAKQNKLIQELEAEIKRASNVGKVGFDETGIAIEKASTGLLGMGKAATQGLSALRTIAYILPGIGIAGIFNLAFDAITAAASAMGVFGKSTEQSAKELKELQDIENDKNGKSGYIDSAVALSNLTEKVKLAKGGFLDKSAVLKEYNDTLGATIGKVNSLEQAEQAIVDKGPAYLKFLLLKAKAEYAFKKAAEDSYNASVAQDKLDAKKPQFSGNAKALLQSGKLGEQPLADNGIKPLDSFLKKSTLVSSGVTDNINKINVANKNLGLASELAAKKQLASLSSVEVKSQKAAQKAFDQVQQFAKENDFNVFDVKPDKASGAGENLFNTLSKQLDDILRKSQALSGESGLTGYQLEVQKINDKYKDLNATLDENIRKTQDSEKLSVGEKATLSGKQETDRVALQKAMNKELDDEFNKSVAKALEATDKILEARKEAKEKSVKLEQELNDKIADINNISVANIGSKQETETQKIQLEWEKRKKAAQDYYDQLIKLNNNSGTTADDPYGFNKAIKTIQLQIGKSNSITGANAAANSQITNKLLEPFTKGIDNGLRKFATDFYSTLTDVDTYAKGTFTSIFADLTGKLTTSLNQVFLNVVVQGLSNALQKAISNPGNGLVNSNGGLTTLGKIAGGATIAGGIISSATPKTSTIGQGLGGALSGAGTGAAIGSLLGPAGTLVGGVVGGLVGLVGGIFGSSSARKKQEELQKQQLEEAKKQTELLRQQQVAYTSQIIGRMTANGTVTGVSVGSQGQLVATVSGKDLQFVLDRTKNGR